MTASTKSHKPQGAHVQQPHKPGQPVRQAGPRRRPSRAGWKVALAVSAVVALAAILAIVASDSDSGSKKTAAGIEQTRSVTVAGTPLAPLSDAGGADPAIGAIAPSLSGQSFDGTAVSYTPGTPTLLVFLAHWCPHCRAEVPVLVQWQAGGKAPAGLDVIGVSTGVDKTLPNYPPSNWLEGESFPWPVLADSATSNAANAMGLTGFPYFVLVDASGAVLARASGELTPAALDALVATAVSG